MAEPQVCPPIFQSPATAFCPIRSIVRRSPDLPPFRTYRKFPVFEKGNFSSRVIGAKFDFQRDQSGAEISDALNDILFELGIFISLRRGKLCRFRLFINIFDSFGDAAKHINKL